MVQGTIFPREYGSGHMISGDTIFPVKPVEFTDRAEK